MSAGETLSKIIVVTINLIFLLFGLAALIAGIVFKVNGWKDVSTIFDLPDTDNLDIKIAGEALGLGAIIFGAFIVVLSIMGLIGGCCKVKCLLVFYAIIVTILLIAEIAIVIFVGVKAKDIEDNTKKELSKHIDDKYHEDYKNGSSKTWNLVFKRLECCGASGREDFVNLTQTFQSQYRPPQYKTVNNTVPIACCSGYDFEGTENLNNSATWDNREKCLVHPFSESYQKGCVDKSVSFITDNKWIFIGVGIAIFVIELLVIAMSFYLCSRND